MTALHLQHRLVQDAIKGTHKITAFTGDQIKRLNVTGSWGSSAAVVVRTEDLIDRGESWYVGFGENPAYVFPNRERPLRIPSFPFYQAQLSRTKKKDPNDLVLKLDDKNPTLLGDRLRPIQLGPLEKRPLIEAKRALATVFHWQAKRELNEIFSETLSLRTIDTIYQQVFAGMRLGPTFALFQNAGDEIYGLADILRENQLYAIGGNAWLLSGMYYATVKQDMPRALKCFVLSYDQFMSSGLDEQAEEVRLYFDHYLSYFLSQANGAATADQIVKTIRSLYGIRYAYPFIEMICAMTTPIAEIREQLLGQRDVTKIEQARSRYADTGPIAYIQ